MFIRTAFAEIKNNIARPQEVPVTESIFSAGDILAWLAVFVGLLGIIILIVSLFFYLLAAGEEPKMEKAHNVLKGGIFCLLGGIILYSIGLWLS